MTVDKPLSNSTSPAPATPTLPSKSATSPSPIVIGVASNQPTATPSPTVQVNQPQPTASKIDSPKVSVSVPAAVSPVSSATSSQARATNSPSDLINNSNIGKNSGAQAGLGVLPNGGSSGINRNLADDASLGNRSSTGLVAAIALSAVAIFLVSLMMIKILTSYMRKRKGIQRLRDIIIVDPSESAPSHPRHQENGGVGASPTPILMSSNSYSNSQSSKSPSNFPRTHSIIYSNDCGNYLDYPRRESHSSMVEFVHPTNPFGDSKTWDGSRPSQPLSWR